MSVRGSDIKLFHQNRSAIAEMNKEDNGESYCECDFDHNVSFDQLPIFRNKYGEDQLDICDSCHECFNDLCDQLRESYDSYEEPYDQREGMYDNPHYYQSLIEK